jgi:hypothetical protein
VPRPGGRAFHIHLEATEIDKMNKGYALAPIALALPPKRGMPAMDLDFNGPFRALSLTSVLNIFSLLLQESQLLFLSSKASLVTEICETFQSLLFPLSWQCCYVPRLPDALSACLDYPGGFVLGMHVDPVVRNGKIDPKDFLKGLTLQDTVHVVNLDDGTISKPGGEGTLGSGMFSSQPYKMLPSFPLATLKRKLESELKRVGMVAGRGDGLLDYDSAFEFAPTPDIQEMLQARGMGEQNMNADIVRDAFLCFMADAMGNYTDFLVNPTKSGGGDNKWGGDLETYIDTQAMIDAAERKDRMSNTGGGRMEFLTSLVSTQMFSVLVQQRTSSSSNDDRLVFFEQVVALCNRINQHADDDDDKDEKYPPPPSSPSPSKRLASLFNTRGGVANIQYLKKGLNQKNTNIIEGGGKPEGLVVQLVNEDMGSFEGDDYKDLSQLSIKDRISEGDEDAALASASSNVPSVHTHVEDKGCDADTSVSVSSRQPLEIPGPSSEGLENSEEDSSEATTGGGRRRAETNTLERQWHYPNGWPTPLEESYFKYPLKCLPEIVRSLRSQAEEHKVQETRAILTRSGEY